MSCILQESYCDVTLACDGRFYSLHKFVLSTCSDYFEEMFERTQCKHPVIVLKDIKSDDLEALLNYMYVGEVNVVQEKLGGLIKAAECLQIKGLAVPDEDPLESGSCSTRDHHKRAPQRSEDSPRAKRRRRDNHPSDVSDDNTRNNSSNVNRLSGRSKENQQSVMSSSEEQDSLQDASTSGDQRTDNTFNRHKNTANKTNKASSHKNVQRPEEVSLIDNVVVIIVVVVVSSVNITCS